MRNFHIPYKDVARTWATSFSELAVVRLYALGQGGQVSIHGLSAALGKVAVSGAPPPVRVEPGLGTLSNFLSFF